jgi:tetratricopeptide (TPR) repeat protein
MPAEQQIAEELSLALRHRQIARGVAILDGAKANLLQIQPETPNAASLLLLIAQWVDVGYPDHVLLETLLKRFTPECRKKLCVDDYLRLRLAEASHALLTGNADSTIDALEFVLKTEQNFPDPALAALAHFWKGRAHRKKGEYEASLQDLIRAREFAQESKDDLLTAVIQIQESWLLFQSGKRREALRLLAHAEGALQATDHFIALGNIESARGRIVRRAGEYAAALGHFEHAIALYAKGDPNHRNLARTLVNASYVKRLLAVQLRKQIDRSVQLGRTVAGTGLKPAMDSREEFRTRYEQLSQSAFLDLTRSREIYALHANNDGFGRVALNLGYLHLDRGEIDQSALEASEAYRLGLQQKDHILMARARILQVAIENAHVEEQTGEEADIALHATQARDYGDEALTLAQETQNRRLRASACIARGTTAANDFFQEWEVARRYSGEAADLIGPGENDHIVEDLTALKSKIVQASGINDTLRGWSEGLVSGKTFQQITEEFAEIVIPKVWLREDRKISRVAESLSVSPKKVRRILRKAGLLGRG